MNSSLQFNYDPLYQIFRLQLGRHEIVGCTEQECLLQAVEFIEQRKSQVAPLRKQSKSWWPFG